MSFHRHYMGKVYLCCGSPSELPASCDVQTASHNPLLTGRITLSNLSILRLIDRNTQTNSCVFVHTSWLFYMSICNKVSCGPVGANKWYSFYSFLENNLISTVGLLSLSQSHSSPFTHLFRILDRLCQELHFNFTSPH